MAILKTVYKIEETVSEILMATIILLVFLAAMLRWFGYPIVWSVDIAQLLFGWVVFLGADMALRNNNHIGIDILIAKFPPKVQNAILLASYALIGAFLAVITVYGFYLSVINYERTFNTFELSYSYATVSVPVGCVLMLTTVCTKVAALLKSGKTDAGAQQRTEVS
ncbi:TRAP transporter small permease [Anaeroselena agilis]|uniref:TRAP transporter small permease n=1 Tax=Anaeroselena agilis TaxID=3063788 RepID=A0ABU3P1I8_9FIRM|nr:TRAP transporter small permease [Selenomonadales bacterium 4137-cl]